MVGDKDEDPQRVGATWGRRPATPPADPSAIERDTERARPLDDEVASPADDEGGGPTVDERGGPTEDEALDRAGEAGAISGPASSGEPRGLGGGTTPDSQDG
jgi:hypothetical protein